MERKNKGASIIQLPLDYVLIDVETTGLDYDFCEIIEVSALKVVDGVVVDSFTSLVKPTSFFKVDNGRNLEICYVDSFITSLTGITNEMLSKAPLATSVLPHLLDFIGDSILMAHNANFDINFLYDAYNKLGVAFSNNFIDTLRIFRKSLPHLQHHRLIDIANELHISVDCQHRAESDCLTTYSCYQEVRKRILSQSTEEAFIASFKKCYKHAKLNARDISPQTNDFDVSHPLYGRTVVFTGALSCMTRRSAMQLVSNVGGINGNTVTKKTNYLVIGSEEFASSVKNGKTTKMRKAECLKLAGSDITIISENTFFDLLENC